MADAGIKVIVFGGCGFIGRNLVEYILEKEVASFIRVVDKVPPQVAWLNKKHQQVFQDRRVEFCSANLINPVSTETAFEGAEFQYAINCACETKLGQTDPVYEEGVYKVSTNCAKAAAKHRVKRFVEISSGQMYSSEKTSHREDDKVDPWTPIARYKHKVEEELKNIENLNYVILRPAIVYGIGDRTGLGARLIISGLYKFLGEKMTLLWNRDLSMNTVHVIDVCRAIWHIATMPQQGEIYNVSDDGSTTQGMLTDAVAQVFSIQYGYWGNKASSLCKLDMNMVVEEINDKHMGPWAKLCLQDGVVNTPLSPYIHKELLYNKHLNLSTVKIKATGFQVQIPKPTSQLMKEIIEDYIEMNMFPKSLLS